MIPVFFNGHGEWFIKNKNGQIYPHSDLISYVEYDSYHRCWRRTNPYDKASGLFMLTEEDENKRNEKEQKHKSQGYRFDEFNLNFVNTLELLPDSFSQCYLDCAALPPGPEIEADSKYFFKIKKYKNADCNLDDKLNPILYPVNIDESNKIATTTNAETVPNNLNKSNKLAFLNQASDRFWRNADKSNKATWPDTKAIVSWLQERGLSESLAEKSASIIRPEWAGSGRPPAE
jgi:hypothetical protein